MIYHLHSPNELAMGRFARNRDWQDQPFWMLNTFRYLSGAPAAEAARRYGQQMRSVLEGVGARVVMQAPVARTAIGERKWGAAAVVEYPSPEAFHTMATGDALAAASPDRIASFADQYLIPVSRGFMPGYDPDAPVRPRSDIRTWNRAALEATPNAFIGEHHTQMSVDRAMALLEDPRFDHSQPVWMLNLLKYSPDGGKALHVGYIAAGGQSFPGGSLGRQFGLRVVYSARYLPHAHRRRGLGFSGDRRLPERSPLPDDGREHGLHSGSRGTARRPRPHVHRRDAAGVRAHLTTPVEARLRPLSFRLGCRAPDAARGPRVPL